MTGTNEPVSPRPRHSHGGAPSHSITRVARSDVKFVSVGSTNFDNWSIRLNEVPTLNVIDTVFANAHTTLFEADLARSCRMTYDEWRERPCERFGETVAAVIGTRL